MFFLCFHIFTLLSVFILFAGQTFSHFPQPTHLSSATFAKQPLCILTAPNGQTISQAPQATQVVLSTDAYRLDAIFFSSYSNIKSGILDFIAIFGDILLFLVVEHTVAKALKFRIGYLLFKFPAHTLCILVFFYSTRTVSSCPFKSFFYCFNNFCIGIFFDFHVYPPVIVQRLIFSTSVYAAIISFFYFSFRDVITIRLWEF